MTNAQTVDAADFNIREALITLSNLEDRLGLSSVADLQARAARARTFVGYARDTTDLQTRVDNLINAESVIVALIGKSKTSQADRYVAAMALAEVVAARAFTAALMWANETEEV